MDMANKLVKIAKIKSDIDEIDEVLNAQCFDRTKAENIISKHNTTDEVVGVMNSPLNPSFQPFYMASDEAVITNLCAIRKWLMLKLVKEQNNG